MTTESEFFKGKRPWSKIKDQVIGKYLVPYLNKVSKLGRRIVVVDGFAGQGIFEDGSEGSPMIICKVAEKQVPRNYLGIFVNKDTNTHKKLEKSLNRYIEKGTAIIIKGNAQNLLKVFRNRVEDATLLIYLDPFGLKGCEFKLLEPYLGRSKSFSTEIIINLSMPTLHRLGTYKALKEERITARTKNLNKRLTEILGGEYWKEIMWSNLPAEEKEKLIIQKYLKLLRQYLPYGGFCPVREDIGKRVKYYIIFCSRHKDALILMNDFMCEAYFKTMHEIEYRGTLFEKELEWRKTSTSQRGDIRKVIKQVIKRNPGILRKELWFEIIKANFMRWLMTEFRGTVKEMVKQQEIETLGHKLNKDCPLYLKKNPCNSATAILTSNRVKIHRQSYRMLDGRRRILVTRVNDGSIIKRFDKTPYPEKPTDVVCPHFLELKWAYGCPFDCSWCYLKGTFRFRPEGIKPAFKPVEKVKLHTEAFLSQVDTPEILNTGEIADSLMKEGKNFSFSKFIIPMFEKQNKHKVLFVTKSDNIRNILDIPKINQAIFSFSLNAIPVAKKWEKGAPSVKRRIKAAQKLYNRDLLVRIRIDPIVPIESWEEYYKDLLDLIFNNFIPERITLGSLRGLQSTINNVSDKSWTKYLNENSNWGKKIDFKTRLSMYSSVIKYLKNEYNYKNVALCKETVRIWTELDLNWKEIKCNCIQ